MISGSWLCNSFKVQLLQGAQRLNQDALFMALYGSDATINADTTAYITAGEISGPGYTPGGQPIVNVQILGPANGIAYATFDDPIWANSTLVARGALIYNQTAGQSSVAVVDFGSEVSSNQGAFRVKLPPPGPTTALIRLM